MDTNAKQWACGLERAQTEQHLNLVHNRCFGSSLFWGEWRGSPCIGRQLDRRQQSATWVAPCRVKARPKTNRIESEEEHHITNAFSAYSLRHQFLWSMLKVTFCAKLLSCISPCFDSVYFSRKSARKTLVGTSMYVNRDFSLPKEMECLKTVFCFTGLVSEPSMWFSIFSRALLLLQGATLLVTLQCLLSVRLEPPPPPERWWL